MATVVVLTSLAIGNVNILSASAQLSDKDDGASTAPGGNETPTAGGWMPMERPGWDSNNASEAYPGQSGQEAGITDCQIKCPGK